MKIQENYMKRAIRLGRNGIGHAAPNPAVGALIVARDKVIGKGWTSPFGGPHAEVNAIHSVKEKSALAESTLYVTLEPCSHFGKTPPCTDLILRSGIPEVVIGLEDPFEKVAGRGIQKLIDAGISVKTGILEKECREHHKRFLSLHQKKRPYIVLKWAMSADGYIAPDPNLRAADPAPYWITNSAARTLVHKWRGEEQAILVGTRTALEDNPRLDTRLWEGKDPLRVVIDRNGKVPDNFFLKDGKTPTLVICETAGTPLDNVSYHRLPFDNNLPSALCRLLSDLGISSILIEGGSMTLQTFIDAGLWDEARIFTGPGNFHEGLRAPQLSGCLLESRSIGNNQLTIYRNDQ